MRSVCVTIEVTIGFAVNAYCVALRLAHSIRPARRCCLLDSFSVSDFSEATMETLI